MRHSKIKMVSSGLGGIDLQYNLILASLIDILKINIFLDHKSEVPLMKWDPVLIDLFTYHLIRLHTMKMFFVKCRTENLL